MKNKKLTVVIHGFFRNGPPGLSNNAKNLFRAIKGNYQVSRNNINYKNLIFKNNLRYRSNYERTKDIHEDRTNRKLPPQNPHNKLIRLLPCDRTYRTSYSYHE